MKRVVVDLSELESETLPLDGRFAPGEVDFSQDELQQLIPLEWSAALEPKEGGVRLVGTLKTRIELSCVRCVEPLQQDVERRFDLFFERREDRMFHEDDEIELRKTDTDTSFIVGTELALDEVMREQVVLSVPMKPLCREECKGLCASCGTNLNSGSCACTVPLTNPSFEPLLEIKRRLEGGGGSPS